jgi:hypothetical protein
VLSSEGNSCEVLIVPRRRPYDKIDEEDILTSHHSGLKIDLSHSPKSILSGMVPGDIATITHGPDRGSRGYIDGIEDNGWIWVMLSGKKGKCILTHEDEAKISLPQNIPSVTGPH